MKRAVIACALLLLIWPGPRAAAQSSPWSAPTLISGKTISSWFPNVAVGPAGQVYAIWASNIDGGPTVLFGIDLLMFRELRDNAWSPVNDVAAPGTGGFAVRNSIAVGRDGKLHVLLRSQMRVDYISAPMDDAWSAHSWSAPRRVSNGNPTYYDMIAADREGNLHAFWNESFEEDPKNPNKDCPRCADLFYRRSSDDGLSWSEPINLSRTPEGSTKPQVQIDKDDHIHLAWSEGYDNINGRGTARAVMYRRSADRGLTWDAPISFTLPNDAPQQAAIGLYHDDTPIVVYRATQTNAIYYQIGADNGQHWSQPARIPGVISRPLGQTPWDSYTMATDSAGNVHLIVSGLTSDSADPNSRPSLLHLAWNGQSWSQPDLISDQLFPEWPHAAIGGGNKLHVVWFTRNADDLWDPDHGHYQIWYSAMSLGTPATAPLPLFTPTPEPTAVMLPSPTPVPPTPTPLAPIDARSPPPDGRPTWENVGLRVIGIALLPVVGLLSLLVSISSRARRQRGR